MKVINSFVAGLLFVLISVTSTSGQVFTLNKLIEADLENLQKTKEDRTYFSLNENLFSNTEVKRGDILEFQKMKGEKDRLIILDREEYLPGVISFRGYKEGNREKVFAITFNKGTLNGVYFDNPGAPTYFGYDKVRAENYTSSRNEWVEHRLTCGYNHSDELIPVPHLRTSGALSKQQTTVSSSVAAPLIAAEDDSVTIDLMIVYTQAAEDWASTSSGFGDINGVIAQSVNLSQTALNNSGIGMRLRLVTTHKTTYNEETDGTDSNTRLDRFTDTGDGFMDEVHGIRDNFGADIAALFVKIDDTGGLGWRLNSSGGNPSIGFNLNRVQQVANNFTLIHEIGHNMGNAHSRTQSSSEASDAGGLFHYSAGFQNTVSNYHTVMAYQDNNAQQEAPYFSSPDLSFLGTATGQNSSTVPTNNARSMREIKRTISNYRDTQIDAPQASLLADVITIEMNREETLNIPFTIFNDGESILVWDIDFGFADGTFKRNKNQKVSNELVAVERLDLQRVKAPANYSKRENNLAKSAASEQVLFSTSFESEDGFSTGTYEALLDWRVTSGSGNFEISGVNPVSGSQHLRISGDATSNPRFVSPPFIGYQGFGSYEIKFDFSVSSTSEVFFIDIYDSKSGHKSSGITIQQGIFFSAYITEENTVSYRGLLSAGINENQTYEMRIVMDPDDEKIKYFLDGVLKYENDYMFGTRPGDIDIYHANSETNEFIDIDNIEIKQISAPFPWLSVSQSTGFTVEDGSSNRSLQFSTIGVGAGTYQTTMKVRTNDPQNPVFEVPITLTVANVVSNEPEDGPERISLSQNYPNPFNPATTINYSLRQTEEIRLEVFNIQGQKVATLFEGKQQAGDHEAQFDASNLSSGVYMYRLQTGTQVLTRQMVLIK